MTLRTAGGKKSINRVCTKIKPTGCIKMEKLPLLKGESSFETYAVLTTKLEKKQKNVPSNTIWIRNGSSRDTGGGPGWVLGLPDCL